MVHVLALMPCVVDMPDVVGGELVLVALMDKLLRGVDEKDVGVGLALFLSTMIQVAMETPKKRLSGSWMTVSTKLFLMR